MNCIQGTICFEWMKGVPAAFVTLFIGAIATRITFNQFLVARAKLKLDLFEKRISVFHKTWDDVADVVIRGTITTTSTEEDDFSTPFSNYRPEAAFLFGKDIDAYMEELSAKWNELYDLKLESIDVDGEKPDVFGERTRKYRAVTDWFAVQANTGMKAKFSSYLDFANWK